MQSVPPEVICILDVPFKGVVRGAVAEDPGGETIFVFRRITIMNQTVDVCGASCTVFRQLRSKSQASILVSRGRRIPLTHITIPPRSANKKGQLSPKDPR